MTSKAIPKYAIFGNVFEQRSVSTTPKNKGKDRLIKRYFVSSEFIQLFYKCLNVEFSDELYNGLLDSEKFLLSKMALFMKMPENPAFNIAVARFMKTILERVRFIEAAVRAGNLSKELQLEYIDLIDKMIAAGVVTKYNGGYQKTLMRNTPLKDDGSA